MELDQYALGTEIEGGSFCWWLEYRTRTVGSIKGGSAVKHLIWHRKDGTWRWPSEYTSVDAAWTSVRAGFVEMLDLAAQGDLVAAGSVAALSGATALRLKTLYMYFPDRLLPIFNKRHLDHFLARLGVEYSGWSALQTNLHLLEHLRGVPQLADRSTQELMYLLYAWDSPVSTTRIVKIAPGERGRFWDDCVAGGYVCVGWSDVGDLTEFGSKDEYRAAFASCWPYDGNESQVTRKSNELWTLMELEPGDKVVANRGTSEILGIGTVTDGGYEWRPDREEMRHTVAVDWDTTHAGPIEPVKSWAMNTVAKVPATLYRSIVSGGAGPVPADLPSTLDPIYREVEAAVARRGQVVLYGPPGTGKTYTARRAAVWLLEGGSTNSDAAATLADPDAFAAAEERLSSSRPAAQRTWFMVANPQRVWSWSTLFAEGSVDYNYGRIQRNYPNVRAGDLVVGYESTPVKRVVALARVTGEYDPGAPPEQALTLEPVAQVTDGITYEELQTDPVLSSSEPAKHRCQGTLFALSDVEADRLLGLLVERDPSLAGTTGTAVQRLTRLTFHPSYTYEDFVEGFRPRATGTGQLDLVLTDGEFKRVCAAAAAAPEEQFVVLIDEINRGNIPKILGELITLLEKDKRGLTVRLPQSGDDFCVPPNVTVIGTMNTADRSIQLLDTALRRRFAFVELMPDAEVLSGTTAGSLELDMFLDSLNSRIRDMVGRERQVGHALFFADSRPVDSAEEFAGVFRHELLPLLQEYLYEDYTALSELLGDKVIDVEAQRLGDVADDPDELCAALAEHFGTRTSA
jgi:5-methylcytosine-specific restriction protein B